ncbi:MAG TPA: hypothetical protein VNK81_07320 [Thermodesulfobacteriota bacterium]|jgi:hypothetical protein|nr:hypothetical protein [Thermodesulfobacteriota bacterium]
MTESVEYREPEPTKCEKQFLYLEPTGEYEDPDHGSGILVTVITLLACRLRRSPKKRNRY